MSFETSVILLLKYNYQQKSLLVIQEINSCQYKLIKFIPTITMGNQCLAKDVQTDPNYDFTSFLTGIDRRENNFIHHDELIQCSNKQVQKLITPIVQQLQQKKTLYRDPLLKTDQITLRSETAQIKCIYQRPYKILDLNRESIYKVFEQKNSFPSSILVQDVAMQYFGTFLCFISQNVHLLKDIILTNQNSYGLHVVKTINKAKNQDILVDDLILCHNYQPVFSQPSNRNYMWPCILEKAWFKIKGSLKRVVKTSPQEVFESFLPFPIQKVYLQDDKDEKIVEKIRKYLHKVQMGNGVIITTKQKPKHRIGLSDTQHLYFIRSFDHEGKRLFYLRNPCGKFDFRGIYSSIPSQIEIEIKQLQKINYIPDGNIVLDQQELFQQISQITIIHNLPNIKLVPTTLTFQQNIQFFVNFQVENDGPFCLELTQYPAEESKQFPQLQQYSPLTYLLINLDQNKLIGGTQNQEACFGIKNSYFLPDVVQNVPSGRYLLRLKKKRKINSMYSNECLLIGYFSGYNKYKGQKQSQSVFDYNNQLQMSTKFSLFLRDFAEKQIQSMSQSTLKKITVKQDFQSKIFWVGDLVFVYIVKIAKKNSIMVQVYFPDLLNLECTSQDLKKGEYKSYEVKDYLILIFQKIDFTQETSIQKYTIESY